VGVRKTTKLVVIKPEGSHCACIPPAQFVLHEVGITGSDTGIPMDIRQVVPVSLTLYQKLREMLEPLATDGLLFSVLSLHIVQFSAPPLGSGSQGQLVAQRQCFHVAAELLEQVMVNVQRVLRLDDRMLVKDEAGVAFVFPEVDRAGIEGILERVFGSVSLLQSQTLEPPLTHETCIMLGCGTYNAARHARQVSSAPALPPLFTLYQQMGCAVHLLNLRPVLAAQLHSTGSHEQNSAPFMQLPTTLPAHLVHVIPFSVACELCCAPVGREHQRLTVALLDPGNEQAIHYLQQLTGLTIFPVQCEEEALNTLLTNGW
jgi:hypothetical protein